MRSDSIYHRAKEVFVESQDPNRFVTFESNIQYLKALEELIEKPFSLALLYGPPGVGKTMLINRFVKENEKSNLHMFLRPFLSLEECQVQLAKTIGCETKELFSSNGQRDIIILDEAQLYPKEMLEFLRMLSDTKRFGIILSLHKNEKEEILAKEHFLTRLFTEIEMKPPTTNEFMIYIQKKLIQAELTDLAKRFDKGVCRYIYKFTKGNLRETNKYLYTLFDILEYFDINQPTKINRDKIEKKYLEMCAIHMRYINA